MQRRTELSATDVAAPLNIVNQCRGFRTGIAAPPGPSEMLNSGLLWCVFQKRWTFDQLEDCCACYYGRAACTPLSVKINVTGPLTHSVFVP